MTKILKLYRDSRGAGAVEFALTFPLFLTALIGALEIGNLFLTKAGLSHAINEAARQATLYPTPTDAALKDRVSATRFGLTPEQLVLSTSRGTDPTRGDYVIIDASYDAKLMTSIIPSGGMPLTERRIVWVQPAI